MDKWCAVRQVFNVTVHHDKVDGVPFILFANALNTKTVEIKLNCKNICC